MTYDILYYYRNFIHNDDGIRQFFMRIYFFFFNSLLLLHEVGTVHARFARKTFRQTCCCSAFCTGCGVYTIRPRLRRSEKTRSHACRYFARIESILAVPQSEAAHKDATSPSCAFAFASRAYLQKWRMAECGPDRKTGKITITDDGKI